MRIRENKDAGGSANAEIDVGVPYEVVDSWPWEVVDYKDIWSRSKIREYLANWAKETGLIRNPNARDIIGRLASNHYALQLALKAIGNPNNFTPKVGRRCAFVVEQECYKNIRQCMIDLDISPLKLSPAQRAQSPQDNRQNQFDFRPQIVQVDDGTP